MHFLKALHFFIKCLKLFWLVDHYLNRANIYKYVSISCGNLHYCFSWLLGCRLNLVNSVNFTYMLIYVTLCPLHGFMMLHIYYLFGYFSESSTAWPRDDRRCFSAATEEETPPSIYCKPLALTSCWLDACALINFSGSWPIMEFFRT